MAKGRNASRSPAPPQVRVVEQRNGPVPVSEKVALVQTTEQRVPTTKQKSLNSNAQMNGYSSNTKPVNNIPYTSDGVKDNDVFWLPASDYNIMFITTILAAIIRFYRIYQPTSVVFDEVHFGGFASKYIKGRFFMDVHPPLAKLLITLAGWLGGFNGNFDFKEIGKDYLEPNVPYVWMRALPAICGVLLVPTMFLTLKAAGCRTMIATMGALLIVFENGLLTQARLILLDSPLMIGTGFTALAFTSFTNQHEQGPSKAFKPNWWFWLVMTGLGLGATVSMKWVGLFTIAWVGSLTVIQLWVLLGDYKNVTPRLMTKHILARVFCLIVIPIAFYMGMFAIHFLCLTNPGEGDGFMSSEFQATLNSKGMRDTPANVAFGSRVSIRHHNTQGGYLHSHPLMYPTGSKQQQITLYPHKDENNVWLLENTTQPLDTAGNAINGSFAWDNITPPTFIKDGDTIKLWHAPTKRRLHSHDVRAPVTEAEWQNEVSAYGYAGFDGDANDFFRVEIVKSKSEGDLAKQTVRAIQTKFRLIHIMTGCALFSHKVKLPEWASEQQEVTCAKQGTLPNSIWYIEQNEHPAIGPDAEKVNYKNPGFLGKFWELQKVMWTTNAGLLDSHAWDSRPQSWPILRRGINFWGKDHRQIYLIGNPIIWWSSSVAVAIFAVFQGIALLRWQRGYKDFNSVPFKRFDYEIGTFVLGWAFHYFPFFLMQRQLFLHHYFPALYFAILTFCQTYDFVTSRISGLGLKSRKWIGTSGAVVFLALSIVAFGLYSPLAYGNPWSQVACKKVQLFSTWDWDCNNFLQDINDYKMLDASKSSPISPAGIVPTSAPVPIGAAAAGGLAGDVKAKVDAAAASAPLAVGAAAAGGLAGDIKAKVEAAAGAAKVHRPAAQQPIVPPKQEAAQAANEDGIMSEAPRFRPAPSHSFGHSIVSREEKIEYRDQDGNLLDEAAVKALEGKVSFKTRYETRTRLIDGSGNEIEPEQAVAAEAAGVAPPHPDEEGVDPETKPVAEQSETVQPAEVKAEDVKVDIAKEDRIPGKIAEYKEAQPASDVEEATESAPAAEI